MRRVAHRRLPLGPARDPGPGTPPAGDRAAPRPSRGAREHNLRNVTVEDPARALRLRHRCQRLGEVDARARRAASSARAEGERLAAAAGQAQEADRLGADRQGDRHRPIADRAHPAVEPRHVHRRVRPHPQAVRAGARGARPRLPAGPVLVQRPRRAVRELRRRRPDQDRDALPARRLRDVRGVQGAQVQPRDARGEVQGPHDRRRPGDERRRGARVLREHPADPPAHADAGRRRARAT